MSTVTNEIVSKDELATKYTFYMWIKRTDYIH